MASFVFTDIKKKVSFVIEKKNCQPLVPSGGEQVTIQLKN